MDPNGLELQLRLNSAKELQVLTGFRLKFALAIEPPVESDILLQWSKTSAMEAVGKAKGVWEPKLRVQDRSLVPHGTDQAQMHPVVVLRVEMGDIRMT